jgi:hypothetical protein
MTQQEKLREEAAICRKSAERVQDVDSRLALMELADWWTMQADRARTWEPAGAQVSGRGIDRTWPQAIERAKSVRT